MKVEYVEELISVFNNDSDGNSPTIGLCMTSPLDSSPLPGSSQKSPIPLSHLPSYVVHPTSFSIVDYLKRIQASKEVRNDFKTLNCDTLDI